MGIFLSTLLSHAWLISADAKDWAITGTILTPDKVIASGAITISGQAIKAVEPDSSIQKYVPTTKLEGIILPGFIDLHNHLTWNILPRWVPNYKFANRYEWQDTAEYDRALVAPHNAVLRDAACEAEIYAEVKAIIGGSTSLVGSLLPDKDNPDNKECSKGLARNLDIFSDLDFKKPQIENLCEKDLGKIQGLLDVVDYEVFPMEIPHARMDFLRCALASGSLRSLIVHLSEGAPNDASAHREFRMLHSAGLILPGLVVVHGTALRPEDFQVMSKMSGLVWSPRSNDELYGATSNIPAALQNSVSVAIAPDWSPTGSDGMLQEIGYAARRYNWFAPEQLIAMATSIPAKMSRLDDHLGSISPGMIADLVVIRGDKSKPFNSVVRASPADVLLVVVGGQAIYGDANILAELLPGAPLETLTVCGSRKAIYLGNSAAALRGETFAKIQDILNAALAKAGSSLPAIECN